MAMSQFNPRLSDQAGFTLMEMIIVSALVMVAAAMAIPVTMQMVSSARGDTALVMTATFLESARSRAVAERRNVELVFIEPNQMEIVRIEVPSGDRTVIGALLLEGDEEFVKLSSLPDTPDDFNVENEEAIFFTGAEPWMFTSDGSLIDSAGDVANGTVHIARPGSLDTARAISIAGVTGMVRSWKWRGSSWEQ